MDHGIERDTGAVRVLIARQEVRISVHGVRRTGRRDGIQVRDVISGLEAAEERGGVP
jgi:hypothetical protein